MLNGLVFENEGGARNCPSLNPTSPRVSDFSRKVAFGRVRARVSIMVSDQMPVH
jgi:hypothetical protein